MSDELNISRKEKFLADLMPKRTAFIAWCQKRGIETDEDVNAWGDRKFKHSHVEAMWDGWFNAPAQEQAKPSEEPRPELIGQLLEYAGNPGFSHGDYADTMKQAASCIEQLSYCVELYQGKYAAASAELIERAHPPASPSAPERSGEIRAEVLEEARKMCRFIAEGTSGAYREACNTLAACMQTLKYEAPAASSSAAPSDDPDGYIFTGIIGSTQTKLVCKDIETARRLQVGGDITPYWTAALAALTGASQSVLTDADIRSAYQTGFEDFAGPKQFRHASNYDDYHLAGLRAVRNAIERHLKKASHD